MLKKSVRGGKENEHTGRPCVWGLQLWLVQVRFWQTLLAAPAAITAQDVLGYVIYDSSM